MQFPNGAGYFDYEDVPQQFNYEKSNINIFDELLFESESVVSGGHDHLPCKNGGRSKSPLSTCADTRP